MRRVVADRHPIDDFTIAHVGTLWMCACGQNSVVTPDQHEAFAKLRDDHIHYEQTKLLRLFGLPPFKHEQQQPEIDR